MLFMRRLLLLNLRLFIDIDLLDFSSISFYFNFSLPSFLRFFFFFYLTFVVPIRRFKNRNSLLEKEMHFLDLFVTKKIAGGEREREYIKVCKIDFFFKRETTISRLLNERFSLLCMITISGRTMRK